MLDMIPGGRGGKLYMFRINVPGGKTLEVALESEGEMSSWIENIRSCTDIADSRVSLCYCYSCRVVCLGVVSRRKHCTCIRHTVVVVEF